MDAPQDPKPKQPAKSGARDARLKAALKANMARRKMQARQRAEPDGAQAGPEQDED